MSPEDIFVKAEQSLASKLPAGARLKRAACLSRIRSLQASRTKGVTLTDDILLESFLADVGRDPQLYFYYNTLRDDLAPQSDSAQHAQGKPQVGVSPSSPRAVRRSQKKAQAQQGIHAEGAASLADKPAASVPLAERPMDIRGVRGMASSVPQNATTDAAEINRPARVASSARMPETGETTKSVSASPTAPTRDVANIGSRPEIHSAIPYDRLDAATLNDTGRVNVSLKDLFEAQPMPPVEKENSSAKKGGARGFFRKLFRKN